MRARFVAVLAVGVAPVLAGLVGPSVRSTSTPVAMALPAAAGATLSVDGAVRYQTIDGWGVNANPKNWGNTAYPPLKPGLDLLANDLGATLWRVDLFGTSMWEASNDNADPFTYNWTYYNNLYSTDPAFVSLWATLHELNAQGIQPILSASGDVPAWLGGTIINNDDEFVEMFSSLVYYARTTAHIQFTLVDPLNETNYYPPYTSPEGPSVDPNHFDAILSKLRARLVGLGMSDVRFVAPEMSVPDGMYDGPILADPTVAPYMRAFAAHNYSPFDLSQVVTQIQQSAYPQTPFWMTEYSSNLYGMLDSGQQVPDEWAFTKDMTNNLFTYLSTGASAALVWDAYDNFHDHAGTYTYWGLLDALNGYTPRKRYYGAKQVFRYVSPGSVRVGANVAVNGLQVLAFSNGGTGQLTIVGVNQSGGDIALTGSVANLVPPTSLSLYETTSTLNTQHVGDIAVSGGAFSVTIPSDSIFTLTGAGTTASVGGSAAPPSLDVVRTQASDGASDRTHLAISGVVSATIIGVLLGSWIVRTRRHR